MSRRVLLALGAVVAVGVAVAAVVVAGAADDGSEAAAGAPVEDLTAIADVAERFAGALLTYEADDLDASRATMEGVATERFLSLYTQTLDEGLAGTIGDVDGSAAATVREVFVGPVVGDDGSAIVVLDAEVSGEGGTRSLTGLYLRLELLRGTDGAWRVDELLTLTAEDVELQ